MKKLLFTLVAAVCLLLAGSGTAWADTEAMSFSSFTKDQDFSGTCFSIASTFNADLQTDSYKLRINKSVTIADSTISDAVLINVLNNKMITGITMTGKTAVSITAVYVDEVIESVISESLSFTTGGAEVSLSGLKATKSICLVFDRGSNTQLKNFSATFTYEDRPVEIPEDATVITLTNDFNTASTDQPFSVSPEGNEIFSTTGYSVVGLTEGAVKTIGDKPMKQFINNSGDGITASAANQIEFTAIPKKGVTFVVTGVSFSISKVGATGPTMDLVIGANGATYQTLETEYALQRDNATPPYTSYSKENLSVTCDKDNYLSLCVRPNIPLNNKSIAISDVTITGYYTGTPIEEATYNVSATANDEALGTVSQSPSGSALIQGSKVSFTAAAKTGSKFIHWINGDNEVVSTDATYTIESLDADVTLIAVFQKLIAVTYTAGGATGTVPDKEYIDLDNGEVLTLPARNNFLYLEGSTMIGWSDGNKTYSFGEKIELTDDITLSAVFAENAKTLTELIAEPRTEALVVNWTFNQSKGAPVLNFENKTGVYVITATIAGQAIDLPMHINTVKSAIITDMTGKLNNVSNKTFAQVNTGTQMTIPVIAGGKVAYDLCKGTLSESTINDEAATSYTCTADGDIALVVRDASIYLNGVTVTYPANAYSVTVSELGAATLCLPDATEVPDGVNAYTGRLADDQSYLQLSEVEQIIPAGEAVLIYAAPGAYIFPKSAEAGTKAAQNDLVGNATDAEITPDVEDATVCVLDAVNDELGFYAWSGAIPSHMAYLPVPKATDGQAAPAIRIIFGDEPGNVTAIDRLTVDNDADAPLYNLAGQRVQGNVAPGLYIRGGKKVVIK
jgi:hypothetical protein